MSLLLCVRQPCVLLRAWQPPTTYLPRCLCRRGYRHARSAQLSALGRTQFPAGKHLQSAAAGGIVSGAGCVCSPTVTCWLRFIVRREIRYVVETRPMLRPWRSRQRTRQFQTAPRANAAHGPVPGAKSVEGGRLTPTVSLSLLRARVPTRRLRSTGLPLDRASHCVPSRACPGTRTGSSPAKAAANHHRPAQCAGQTDAAKQCLQGLPARRAGRRYRAKSAQKPRGRG